MKQVVHRPLFPAEMMAPGNAAQRAISRETVWILKRASQLISSVPAGQERDKITAVYSWLSQI